MVEGGHAGRGGGIVARIVRGPGTREAAKSRVSSIGEWVHAHTAGAAVGRRCSVRQAGLTVAHQHRHGDAARRAQTRRLQRPFLPLPFALVATILEPDLDLRGGEAQRAGQVLPLGRGQVTLLREAPLELAHLHLREEHARLPPLPRGGAGRAGPPGLVIGRGAAGGWNETDFQTTVQTKKRG